MKIEDQRSKIYELSNQSGPKAHQPLAETNLCQRPIGKAVLSTAKLSLALPLAEKTQNLINQFGPKAHQPLAETNPRQRRVSLWLKLINQLR